MIQPQALARRPAKFFAMNHWFYYAFKNFQSIQVTYLKFTHAIINEMFQKQYFVSQHSWISRPLDQFSRFRSITSIEAVRCSQLSRGDVHKIVAVDFGETIFKFHFACIVLFPRLQNSKTTQTSDWCFVCAQKLFVKMDFSSSKTISHRKFHSVRKFFTKDGVRSKHLSCIFAKVPGRYESFGRRLHFHHFETSLLVLLKCKHPKKWKRKN